MNTAGPDLGKLLLGAFFPEGISPHQYQNLAILSIYISKLYDLWDQVEWTEKEHSGSNQPGPVRTSPEDKGGNIICRNGTGRQDATLCNVAPNVHECSPVATKSPFGDYPANFEETPIAPIEKPKIETTEITDEVKFEVVRLHNTGMKPAEIAAELGISNTRHVTGILLGKNRWGKAHIKCHSCGQDTVIKYGRNNGKQQYKCTACGKKYGEDSKLKETTRQSAQQFALELRDKGFSLEDVATKLTDEGYPVDRSTVSRWFSGRKESVQNVAERTSQSENVSEAPYFSEKIDERILELEFNDQTPEEISQELQKDGATISPEHIAARLVELNTSPDGEDDI